VNSSGPSFLTRMTAHAPMTSGTLHMYIRWCFSAIPLYALMPFPMLRPVYCYSGPLICITFAIQNLYSPVPFPIFSCILSSGTVSYFIIAWFLDCLILLLFLPWLQLIAGPSFAYLNTFQNSCFDCIIPDWKPLMEPRGLMSNVYSAHNNRQK
jgi:hypothetical protein